MHAFWLFDRPVSKESWTHFAVGLRNSALQHGLPADLQCTTDAARVLRVPGTQNRKPQYGQALPVEVIHPEDKSSPTRYTTEQLAPLSKYVAAPQWGGGEVSGRVVHLRQFPPRPPIAGPSELAAGIELNLDEVRSAVAAIPSSVIASEGEWVRFARGLAHAAFVHTTHSEELWTILDAASQNALNYNPSNNRTRWERYIREAGNREQPITIGTVFGLARSAGWGGSADRVTLEGNTGPTLENGERMPLKGGVYDLATALAIFNSHFFIALVKGACPIAQIQDDQTITYLAPKDFSVLVRNIFVRKDDGKLIGGDRFWLAHPNRHQRKVVFRPGALVGEDEYNLWRGFGIVSIRGWNKQCRLLRHIFQVICRRDKIKFRYLLRWLAWAVQHPEQRAETVVVLQSPSQGTGKTTLSNVMREIFGAHGRTVISKARLLSQFNSDFETVCWISGEEMLWAGDKGGADALKSIVTGDTLTLEVKNGPRWDIPNRLHLLLTTNHVHAVAAGTNERRYFVLEVSDEKARQDAWFEPLHNDLDTGGKAQFLWLLQNLRLGNWHPRQIPKTAETVEQQRMSARFSRPMGQRMLRGRRDRCAFRRHVSRARHNYRDPRTAVKLRYLLSDERSSRCRRSSVRQNTHSDVRQ